jgi:hypothetical protein
MQAFLIVPGHSWNIVRRDGGDPTTELLHMHVGTIFIGVETSEDLCNVDSCTRAKRGSESPEALFDRLHRNGIHMIGSLIGGWDGQTAADLEVDADRFVTLNPTFYQILPLTATPGTQLWKTMERQGRIDENYNFERHRVWMSPHASSGISHEAVKSWIERTQSRLVDFGGPWFFRMAENHLRATNGPLAYRNEKQLHKLLPLALSAGLFFKGKEFRKRWGIFVCGSFKKKPFSSGCAMVCGVIFSLYLWLNYHVRLFIIGDRMANELPTFRSFKYSNKLSGV